MNILKRIFSFCILVTALLVFNHAGRAQTQAEVQNVDFYLTGDQVIVSYDLVNAQPGEQFRIEIGIFKASGQKIQATSLDGDIGNNIEPGKGKKIYWDYVRDNMSPEESIYVEVYARLQKKTVTERETPKKIKEKPLADQSTGMGRISGGKALIRSLVFPGWGNRYAKGYGAYWLMGVAGWGCVIGAIVLNNQAATTYDNYKKEMVIDKREQYINDANSQNNLSVGLGAAAAGIWVIDAIWTLAQASHLNKKNNLSFRMNLDPCTRNPVVYLSYKW